MGIAALSVSTPEWAPALQFESDPSIELRQRQATLQVGYWLGWASIVGRARRARARRRHATHSRLLVAITLAAAAANTVAMVMPWREWLHYASRPRAARSLVRRPDRVRRAARRERRDELRAAPLSRLFRSSPSSRSAGVAASGSRRARARALPPRYPLFGRRDRDAAGARCCSVWCRGRPRAHNPPRGFGAQAAAARAELERTLAIEANHRIKNDLQTVADLLLLGRPADGDGNAFDETAARIRSIATVHRLLAEADTAVDGGALLRHHRERAHAGASRGGAGVFDPATAQKIGIVANELVTNAFQHGAPPIVGAAERRQADLPPRRRRRGRCRAAERPRPRARSADRRAGSRRPFRAGARPGGGTRAEVVFPDGRRDESARSPRTIP